MKVPFSYIWYLKLSKRIKQNKIKQNNLFLASPLHMMNQEKLFRLIYFVYQTAEDDKATNTMLRDRKINKDKN